MKIINKVYAESLIDALDSEKDQSKIARNFWRILQKNKQYQNLGKILDEAEIILATKENKKISFVYSEKELSAEDKKEIGRKLEKFFQTEIILKNIVDEKSIGGIKVKCDGNYLDLTLLNKINQLKNSIR